MRSRRTTSAPARKLPHDNPPRETLVVAVAGGTASGKTTLVDQVGAALGDRVTVLSQDCYYKDCPVGAFETHNFDVPEAIDFAELEADLARLKSGEPINRPRYCYEKHGRLKGTVRVDPKPVVIVEGILVLAVEGVRALADICVFVDHPAELRLARRLARDSAERGHEPAGIVRQYVETVAPAFAEYVRPSMAHADLVVRGEERSITRLVRLIGRIS